MGVMGLFFWEHGAPGFNLFALGRGFTLNIYR